ncbi:MAG: enoyl-CoA hydratase/isomerase family protein [Aestuariivita sp.]|nr:enoyl-CoA hydratase/isomerase family protein [Aestuariivita sp.]MCY4202178.1 enoyl-CoA hydratase/isomerase family protein [Aestuariivita sp.]
MNDLAIRIDGLAGRVTLKRPAQLNALTHDMCLAIENAIDEWRATDAVELILLDAIGERAFCAGGDIIEIYEAGTKGHFECAREFWCDEYRLNAKLATYPKPIVSFLHGYTMGGGVGLGCHVSCRIVGETSKIAMPECGIGLVPDVGGSLLLARAPGRLGEFLGTTGTRMNAADAIYAGFADKFIPEANWDDLKSTLASSGEVASIADYAQPTSNSRFESQLSNIDSHFGGETLVDIKNSLAVDDTEFAAKALKDLSRGSPLAVACTVEIIHRLKNSSKQDIQTALELEYRFTSRAMEHGDFLEGIRAQVIAKDRNPSWQYAAGSVPATAMSKMLLPLGENSLTAKIWSTK